MENSTPAAQPPPFDFTKEKSKYDKIIADFREECDKVKTRREIRENRRNVQEERQKGTILPDETIIPDRTVNTNIRIGRGPYISYLTQSKRFLIITEVDKPDISVESLELWYTRGMRYPRWKMPWIKLTDCMHTHGGAALEVMFDPEKPFNVTIDYIPRDCLIFPRKTKDIQAQSHILRLYEWTLLELEEKGAELGFNPAYIKEILDKHPEDAGECKIKVYRVLCRKNTVVYNSWYTPDIDKGWLRAPQVHDIGLFNFDVNELSTPDMMGAPIFLSQDWDVLKTSFMTPLPLRKYPLFWFPYEVTENETLLEGQGRVALDLHVQEALTSLITSTVNGAHRASRFYPCLKNDPTQDSSTLESTTLRPGEVYPRELAQFQPNWPNPIILSIAQVLQIGKANEAGHSDYAVMARKDANKTATEMELAQAQSQNNISADMDTYSSPVLDVFALCFEVARHQAIFGAVKRPQQPLLLFGDYNLVPAGDVEVVKRAEDKQNAKEFFNIVQGTPAAEKILHFLIERFFPDQADAWIAAISGPDKNQVILQLIAVLEGIINDLGPELDDGKRQAVAALISAARNVAAAGDLNAAGQNTPEQNQQPPQTGAGNTPPAG